MSRQVQIRRVFCCPAPLRPPSGALKFDHCFSSGSVPLEKAGAVGSPPRHYCTHKSARCRRCLYRSHCSSTEEGREAVRSRLHSHSAPPNSARLCTIAFGGARSATSKPHRSSHRRCRRRSEAAGAYFRLRFCRCAAGAAEVGTASALAVVPWSVMLDCA